MSFPIAVNTADGTCWTRRGALRGGEALYAPEGVCSCPEFVMATLAELAEHGIVGSADALPMPAGPGPVSEAELDAALTEVSAFLRVRLALESAKRGRRELRAELHTAQAHGRTFLEQRNAHAKELLELRGRLRVAEDLRVRALGENDALRKQRGDAGRERDTLRERVAELEAERHTTNEALSDAAEQLRKDRDRIAELEAAARQIVHLHKDSPTGPCPVCVDADALARGDDPTLPYPCPTARLAGAEDFDPPSYVAEAGEPS
jgi:hypothetical protein